MVFFLKTSGSKVIALSLTSVGTAILSLRPFYVHCFVYSPLHVCLRVTHTLSYGDKGHLDDCACVRKPSLVTGYNMCTRVRAQTLQHERQGKTLDYGPINYLTSNFCIICAGCCIMLCNCAEGLHFSAFHYSVLPTYKYYGLSMFFLTREITYFIVFHTNSTPAAE